MTQQAAPMYFYVELPDGRRLEGTKSTTPEGATANAMMMDIPRGCRVVRGDGEPTSPKEET